MAVYDFSGSFRNLNSAISGLGQTFEEQRKREAIAGIGAKLSAGDYAGAAQGLMAAGDVTNGLKAMEVGHTRALQADAMRQAGQTFDLNSLGTGGGSALSGIGSGGNVQPQAGGQTLANLGNPNQIETRFMSGIREAGLTNPFGLATVAAYGKRESGWSPQNANRSWSDPSQSGQAGTSGGLFAWRNERLRNLYGFAQQRGENVGSITPETQAAFLASEDPTLIPRLNNANSVAEANQIMANAWRFAGYQGNSPEYNARLQTAMAYLPRYQGDGNTIQRATGQPQPTMVAQAQTGSTTPDMARAGIARVDMLLNDQGRDLTPQQRQSLEERRQKYVQIAEADMPAQGAQPAQGFTPPGQPQRQWDIPPERARAAIVELTRRMGHPGNTEGQRAMYKAQIDQLTPYADPMRSLDRRSKELGIQKAEEELNGGQVSRQAQARAQAAEQFGLQPGTAEHRRYVLTGQMPADASNIEAQSTERARVAESMGLKPGSGAYQSYVLTGKMPREDQQPLTATDKKAILEADELVAANRAAIDNLNTALRLSPQANQGFGASARAAVANAMPDWMVPDFVSSKEGGQATAELDNVVIGNALASLKSIFGAAPTEGERKILLDMQGSTTQPRNVRESIYRRAIELAQRRLTFNEERASQMRGGTYYKPGSGQQSQGAGAVSAPAGAVQALRANPSLAADFDAKYGQGMAAQILR